MLILRKKYANKGYYYYRYITHTEKDISDLDSVTTPVRDTPGAWATPRSTSPSSRALLSLDALRKMARNFGNSVYDPFRQRISHISAQRDAEAS